MSATNIGPFRHVLSALLSFTHYNLEETAGDNIFREHLHRFLLHFQKNEYLATAMRDVVKDRGCRDAHLTDRLQAAGLTKRDSTGKVVSLCGLYRDFFAREL